MTTEATHQETTGTPGAALSRGWGSIIVISAPSGAGKTTLVKSLLPLVPELTFSVSHTTRPPRPGEEGGRDYCFVTEAEFRRMTGAGEFAEWAEVHECLYGTTWTELSRAREAGLDVLLDIDVQGHRQIKERIPEAVSIFVLPPSFEELEARLRRRHSEAPEMIEKRLAAARQEIEHWTEYDFLVVNDSLQEATRALQAVVRAARFRRENQAGRVREICRTFGGTE